MVEANSSSALSLSATWWNETSSNGTLRGGSHQVYVTSLYLAAYCAVFLLSMVGNVAVVIMVLKISKNGGTRACCFIFNLVMCDLLVGIFCVPFTLIQDLLTDGGLADLMCKMTSTVQGIAVCCSVFTLTTVAILRYRWRDHQQQMEISGTTVLVVSIAMWVVAVLFSSPELVVRRTIQPDPEVGGKPACVDVWPSSQLKMVYKGFLFALCFLGPFFVIGYLWVTVGIKTCCASREPQRDVVIERSHSPSATPTRRKGTKYFRMMKVIVAIFCFLWLPLYVSWTLEAYGDYSWFLAWHLPRYCSLRARSSRFLVIVITGRHSFFLDDLKPTHSVKSACSGCQLKRRLSKHLDYQECNVTILGHLDISSDDRISKASRSGTLRNSTKFVCSLLPSSLLSTI